MFIDLFYSLRIYGGFFATWLHIVVFRTLHPSKAAAAIGVSWITVDAVQEAAANVKEASKVTNHGCQDNDTVWEAGCLEVLHAKVLQWKKRNEGETDAKKIRLNDVEVPTSAGTL